MNQPIRWLKILGFILVCSFTSREASAVNVELRTELQKRREAIAEKMGQRGMLILFSPELRPYSGDVSYEFRQENNLFYLTGIRQREITLVLMHQNSSYREILFLPRRNPHRELWSGQMLTAEGATEISGIEKVWSFSEFEPFLDSILYGQPYRTNQYTQSNEYQEFFKDLAENQVTVFLLLQEKPGLTGELNKEFQFGKQIQERFPGIQIKDASKIFSQLRVVKSPYEIEQLKKAINITAEAQLNAIGRLRPGKWEYEVEAVIEYVFRKNNSFDWAFPSIVASGPNATILHYEKSQRQTQEGDLLLMDVGAEYNYYAADITRTVPVNGQFTEEQKLIYQIVLDAQNAALLLVKPGSSMSAIHRKAVDVIAEGLFRLGLINDISGNQYRAFFPHGVGHFLGLDVHDVGSGKSLEPGMVLTVEPGIYVREDSKDRLVAAGVSQSELKDLNKALAKFMHIGVRIEDDVLVKEDGYELLSGGIPRNISEIEALVGKQQHLE